MRNRGTGQEMSRGPAVFDVQSGATSAQQARFARSVVSFASAEEIAKDIVDNEVKPGRVCVGVKE